MEDSTHFRQMLDERGISRAWAERVVQEPDIVEDREDGTRHFIKRIPEFGDRHLRVVVNISTEPPRRITAFFDRRLGRP